MRTTRLLAIASGAVAILAVSGCEASFSVGDKTVDNGQLEKQLAEKLATQAGADPKKVTVDCPDDQKAEKGRTFDCTLTAPNGDKVVVKVTLTDDEGGYNATVPPTTSDPS